MRKRIITSICIILITCGAVFAAFFATLEKITTGNGFLRKINYSNLSLISAIKLEYNSFYIAGLSKNNIYLGNYVAPTYLLRVNYNSKDSSLIKINSDEFDEASWKSFEVSVDSPNIYFMEGITPRIFVGKLNNTKDIKSVNINPTRFTNPIIPISSKSFIFRTYNGKRQMNEISKELIINEKPTITTSKNSLTKQIDGIFCTDGTMSFDQKSQKIIYSYFYRNEFICLDTSLNILYKSNTIDTNSVAKLSMAEIQSEGKKTLTNSPKVINKNIAIGNDHIYIQSTLMSDNERSEYFTSSSVVDVYSLNNGNYESSFYVPNPEQKSFNNIKMKGDTLVALYDNYLFVYKLNDTP